MKPLSESLEELAGRVKVLEDSATATFEADRAKLEQRRHEIDEAFKTEAGEFESAVREAEEAGRTWWNDTKASMKRPLDEVRGTRRARGSPSTSSIVRCAAPTRPKRTPRPPSRSRPTS